jgi:8-oxo-dGTP pyrophosphatase MutT (NUDIX family)
MKVMPDKIPVIAAGGVIFRIKHGKTEILLIFRNGHWDLPKGKVEKGERIEMAAVREVAEETGSSLPTIVSPLGTTYHSYEEKGNTFAKTTHWFSMIFSADQSFMPQTDEGISEIRWMEVGEAIDILGYDNLKEISRRFVASVESVIQNV